MSEEIIPSTSNSNQTSFDGLTPGELYTVQGIPQYENMLGKNSSKQIRLSPSPVEEANIKVVDEDFLIKFEAANGVKDYYLMEIRDSDKNRSLLDIQIISRK